MGDLVLELDQDPGAQDGLFPSLFRISTLGTIQGE
jgi:hypothetical protein